jgi:hypothetical protein
MSSPFSPYPNSYFVEIKMKQKKGANISARRNAAYFISMEVLFLSLRLGIALRRLSIVCSLALGLGQIFSQRSGAPALLPSQTGIQGKRRGTRRLQCTRPSRQLRWFRVCPALLVVPRVPRLCGRCVLLQPVACFGIQGLSAKFVHHF